jgi:hypothetical protein
VDFKEIILGSYTRSLRPVSMCRAAALALMVAVVLAASARVAAHEIPNDVTVQSFLKPEGQRLRLLIRVPIVSMLDISWPRREPDILDLNRADPFLKDAATLWLADNITVYEGTTRLDYPRVAAVRGTVASNRAFESYEQALATVTAPVARDSKDVTISAGFLDVLFEYAIQSEQSRFSIDPRFARLGIRTVTVIRVLLPNGAVRAFEIEGNPGLLRLDPEWSQAAWRFVKLGFHHILDGTDHLLFLFCLVIPFRRFRALAAIVTAFTVAHSITLIASAYNFAPDALWFPPLIETLIATSIVYMALENIVGASVHRRWMITFGFGLVHGFGFSFALRQTLQFAGAHLLTSLVSFNIGVELGQLLVLALMIPALDLLFRFVVAERMGTIILSAIVAHTGWHWMSDRARQLWQYQFAWPELTPAFLAGALRWMMLGVAAAAVAWLVFGVLLKSKREDPERVNSEV